MRGPGTTNDQLPLDRTQTLGPRATESTLPSGGEKAAGSGGGKAGAGGNGGGNGAGTGELDDEPARDRYELLAEHARGGLGRVVRAHDRHLGRTVAVKELLRTNELAEALFVREALITARLQHPGIVPVHEAGRWPNGDPYYVMKLVSGRTLKEVIAETRTLSDRLALLPHVIAVAEAVGYAHSHDIVHRDLKPANMILGEYGETVVIDWGLARDLRASDSTPPLTATPPHNDPGTVTGRVVGTPQYMPPEQARGEAVDPRADVYALGAILYEVLSGRAPVAGDSVQQIIDRVLEGPPATLGRVVPGVPADLEAIVAKAMSRAPDDRYPTARELAADLKRFQTGQLVTAQRYGRWSLCRRWVRKNRGYVALGTIATIAVTVIAIGTLRRVIDERRIAEKRGRQAEAARQNAEERKNEMVIAQAEGALARDPTQALAWLKRYPIDPTTIPAIAPLVDEAEALGVAAHVWRSNDWMQAAALTRDGARAAIGGRDGKVRVIDTVSGAERVLDQGSAVAALGFDAVGGRILSGDTTGRITLWDLASGERKELGQHETEISDIQPAADGHLASIAADGTIKVWDLDHGTLVRDLFAGLPKRDRTATAWDQRDGATTLTGDMDGRLVLRVAGAAPRVVAQLPAPARMMAMTADACRAVVADGKAVYLVDLDSGEVRQVAEHAQKPKQITIDPTQRRAAIAGLIHDVILIDLETGAVEHRRGHEDALYMARFDSRGQRMVTASDDGTTRVWDLDTGDTRVLRGHEDDVYAVAMTPDGRTILTASLDGSARLWRVDDRKTVVVGQLGDVRALQPLGGDVVRVVSISEPQRIYDVDLRERRAKVRAEVEGAIDDSPDISLDGSTVVFGKKPFQAVVWRETGEVTAHVPDETIYADLSQDGTRAVALLDGGKLVTWDKDGLHDLAPPPAGAVAVAVSGDGASLAIASDDGIEVRDVATGASRGTIARAKLGVREKKVGVHFLRDGKRVVVADMEGVHVWRWDTGELVHLEHSPYAWVKVVESADGQLLAGGVENRAVRVWNAQTGAAMVTLSGHHDLVRAMAFSPDAHHLVTGSYDHTVRVWNVATGEGRVLTGHVGPVWSVAWMGPDRVVSGSSDGTVRLWNVPTESAPSPAELVARLRARTTAEIDDHQRPTTPAVTD